MTGLSVGVSPLERGFEGCVTVRNAVWVEMFLLLFGFGVFCQVLGDIFGV